MRVDNPSFVLDSYLLAGGSYVGKYAATEEVVSTVHSIHSFPVVLRVVKLLSIHSVDGLVDSGGFVKGDVVGVVVDGRRDGEGGADECNK